MKDSWIDFLITAVSWWHRNRRYRPPQSPTLVNLGSGLTYVPGWINIDAGLYSWLRKLPRTLLRILYRRSQWNPQMSEDAYIRILNSAVFYQHDLRRGIPFDDSSLDGLYSSHFIDALTAEDNERLFREMLRVMKPGGIIRIAAADLALVFEFYRDGKKQDALAHLFVKTRSQVNTRFSMYDYDLLRAALDRAGFTAIRRCPYRQGEIPDVEVLDSRPGYSFYVEARKPVS